MDAFRSIRFYPIKNKFDCHKIMEDRRRITVGCYKIMEGCLRIMGGCPRIMGGCPKITVECRKIMDITLSRRQLGLPPAVTQLPTSPPVDLPLLATEINRHPTPTHLNNNINTRCNNNNNLFSSSIFSNNSYGNNRCNGSNFNSNNFNNSKFNNNKFNNSSYSNSK